MYELILFSCYNQIICYCLCNNQSTCYCLLLLLFTSRYVVNNIISVLTSSNIICCLNGVNVLLGLLFGHLHKKSGFLNFPFKHGQFMNTKEIIQYSKMMVRILILTGQIRYSKFICYSYTIILLCRNLC